MANTRRSSGAQGRTRAQTQGNILKLEEGIDKEYLCFHLCAASKTPKLGKTDNRLYQKTMTAAIWAEEDAAYNLWKYKMEVGYRMTDNPPSPIMSPKAPNRPSRFPLGIMRSEIEGSTKGLFRIPDCIILKVSEAEIVSMINKEWVDWSKLIPVQANIHRVVEIKFGNDTLSDPQARAYKKIGGASNFRELRDTDCHCQAKRRPAKHPVKVYNYSKIKNLTYKPILRPVRQVATPRFPLSHIFMTDKPPKSGHAPLTPVAADVFLETAAVMVIAGCTVLVGAALAPEIAAGAGVMMMYGYANR